MTTCRLLIHHGRGSPTYYVADTDRQLAFAFLALFKHLDDGDYYTDLRDAGDLTYCGAVAGNCRSARTVLEARRGRQYETWEIVMAVDPCGPVTNDCVTSNP